MLSRPRPELGALLAGCIKRLEGAGDEARERLESVSEKPQQAVRIEGNARRRRGLE